MENTPVDLSHAIGALRSVENFLKGFDRVGEVVRAAAAAEAMLREYEGRLATLTKAIEAAAQAGEEAKQRAAAERDKAAQTVEDARQLAKERVGEIRAKAAERIRNAEVTATDAEATCGARIKVLTEEIASLQQQRNAVQDSLDAARKALDEIKRRIGP